MLSKICTQIQLGFPLQHIKCVMGFLGKCSWFYLAKTKVPILNGFLGTVAASEMAFATQYSYFTRDFALEATTKKLMNTHQIPSLWPPLKPPIDSDALLSLNTVSSGEDTSLIQVSLNRLEKRKKSGRGAGFSHLTSKAAKTDDCQAA